jgi:hypothetical protein
LANFLLINSIEPQVAADDQTAVMMLLARSLASFCRRWAFFEAVLFNQTDPTVASVIFHG